MSVRGVLAGTRLDGEQPQSGKRRENHTRETAPTVSRRALAGEGYRPSSPLGWRSRDPTIARYDHRSLTFRLATRRLF